MTGRTRAVAHLRKGSNLVEPRPVRPQPLSNQEKAGCRRDGMTAFFTLIDATPGRLRGVPRRHLLLVRNAPRDRLSLRAGLRAGRRGGGIIANPSRNLLCGLPIAVYSTLLDLSEADEARFPTPSPACWPPRDCGGSRHRVQQLSALGSLSWRE